MNPKHKLITVVWCSITMVATVILSHGHLVMREVMTHWPTSDSWEGRFETALYTQGGLVFLASCAIGVAIMVRSYIVKVKDEEIARRDRAQRERHERAEERRHEAMIEQLSRLSGGTTVKKPESSGAKPR